MKYEIKSIPLWPVIKVFFIVNLIAGFIIGLLLALVSSGFISFYNEILQVSNPGYDVDLIPVEYFLLFLPLFLALCNGILTTTSMILVIFIYNFLVKFTGGMELNITEISSDITTESEMTLEKSKVDYTSDSAPPPPPSVITEETPEPEKSLLEDPDNKDIE